MPDALRGLRGAFDAEIGTTGKEAMKKGDRVYVVWEDITASLHSDEELNLVVAETVGWILRKGKKELEIATTRYKDGCDFKDRITIHRGTVVSMEKI